MLGHYVALPSKNAKGVPHRALGDAVPVHQLRLTRQAAAWREVPPLDGLAQRVGYLLVDGTIAGGVDLAQFSHDVLLHSGTRVPRDPGTLTGSFLVADVLHSVSVAAAVVNDHGRLLAIQRRDNGR